MYTLDVYTSVVWGGIIRSREQQSNVAYPMELDDEMIDNSDLPLSADSPSGISPSVRRHGSGHQSDCWLSGWNFITDLYRVLEHALARFRGVRSGLRRNSFLNDIFEDETVVTEASVCDRVLQMYLDLPECFKSTPHMTYNVKADRFGFQAANITGSLQLLRMVLFAAGGASIEERCQIASEVVSAFASIPAAYLLAISRPQLHHLGGIGAILGSVFEERLSETDYSHVRSVMLSMAQLMERLEAQNQPGLTASGKLRSHVTKIDEYMARQGIEVDVHKGFSIPDCDAGDANIGDPGIKATNPSEVYGPSGPSDWAFQVPSDLLDEFTWNFDFSSLT